MSVVGKNIPHDAGRTHASGESLFIDDFPLRADEVHVEIFGSPVACGKLTALDIEKAKQVAGVLAVITAADIPGHNKFGPIIVDEVLLADAELSYVGQPIALVVADSREAAIAARRAITADVTPAKPIFSIDEAIAAGQFIGLKRVIETGNVDAALPSAAHKIEGDFVIGGQEHFYLEVQAAIAYPDEHETMHVISSTQHPTETQALCAEVLGVPFNHVVCECRRMGGGFGGKETQAAPVAAMAALAARITGRPARLVLDRDMDMAITGKRHPFKAFYKAGFTAEGKITALAVELYSNGGCTCDLSPSVLERAMLHSDNAYYLPNARIVGRICKTNLPSNTAFRGFGGPQGVAMIENVMQEIARIVGKDPYDIRQLNAYDAANGLVTPYGQTVQNNVIPRLFAELRESSAYDRRRREIAAFNAQSTSHLRGLAMTPVKFGISFTKKTLNQASALVNIYLDGSVLVTTGGTEMGQGLSTRIAQLVADDLGLPLEMVRIGATRTDKNNNTSPTAASAGTDLNGAAALDATGRLRRRLAEFAAPLFARRGAAGDVIFRDGIVSCGDEKMPFKELVAAAYFERINLGERGFYITPGVDFDRDTGKGTPFLYYTNGAAVAEALINRFTGEMRVPRVDLLMDAGIPLNPGIDRGQITGGFIQGMGWVTTEELVYDAAGNLLSHSPTTYKIPNISDVPEIFNVNFLNNPDNVVSVKRSKALGEPPLLLGLCVWSAVKDAITFAASGGSVQFPIPATAEQILLALSRIKSRVAELAPAK